MTLEPHSAGRSSRTQPRGDSQVAEPTRHLRMMGRGRHTPINDCNGAQCATTAIGRKRPLRKRSPAFLHGSELRAATSRRVGALFLLQE